MKKFLNYKLTISLFVIVCSICNPLFAQLTSDALRYSTTRPLSTGRAAGLNGSVGGIGADFNAIGLNPAGLGLFRKSDFTVTGFYQVSKVNSILTGDPGNISSERISDQFSLGGIGLVITSKPKFSKWTNVNFSMGLHQTASFDQKFFFEGKSQGSILNRYLELARDNNYDDGRGIHKDDLDGFEAGLAYEVGAIYDIDPDPNKFVYSTDLAGYKSYALPKSEFIRETGKAQDFSLSLAGNYSEFVSFGLSLAMPFGEYNLQRVYKEKEGRTDEVLPFKSLEFNENVSSSYNGIQGRFGIIIKPVNSFRIGLAWHTPTYHWFSDQFYTSMAYAFKDNKGEELYESFSPDGYFTYRLTTPMKWIGSLAFVGKNGFINLDVDYFNPSEAKFNLTADTDNNAELVYQNQLNQDIKKQYKSVLQFRLGGEIALDKLRLRAGYGLLSSPYANVDEFSHSLSAGIGLRFKRFFMDLGYQLLRKEVGHIPFSTGNSDFNGDGKPDAVTSLVTNNVSQNMLLATIGFKF
ncbi:MAG: hypothetical protein JNK69_08280 [Saprospiraceae bacterium]|nr:hypothetical protein [Candidatus Vicinibacter proximus]MBL7823390.1 hypothetical protein [Saprospiraceae bacterium]MCC6842421.1 hypothetical protein [Saprospiraceae bacterium]HRG32268.1 hypothetical protein [Saprospiraceae bacterium]